MSRFIPRQVRTRLIMLALVGLGFVFAASACGEKSYEPTEASAATSAQ